MTLNGFLMMINACFQTRLYRGVVQRLLALSLSFLAMVPFAQASNIDSNALERWQLVLEKPESDLWFGQPLDYLLVSLSPPTDDLQLSVSESDDFSVVTGRPMPVLRDGLYGIGYPVRMTPLKAGELELPTLTLSGQYRKSVPAQPVMVKTPELTEEMTVNVHRGPEEIYLGQSVRYHFEWITSIPLQALAAVNIVIPELDHAAIKFLEPWNKAITKDERSIGLPVGGKRVIARWHRTADNRTRVHFDFIIQPQAAGRLELRKPIVLASVDTTEIYYTQGGFSGMPYPAHFDNNFFDPEYADSHSNYNRVMATGEALKLTVKALPEGAPEHFSGVVGRPNITLSVTPEEVEQGEPVQLNYQVLHPDIEAFPIPDLQQAAAFSHSFDIPGGAGPIRYEEGVKLSQQSLFPRDSDITAIPPVVINYFDPETGHYRDYVTQPQPIKVTPSEQFSLTSSSLSADVELKNPVKTDDSGIWEHVWQEQLLDDEQAHAMGSPWLPLFLLLPPLLLLFNRMPQIRRQWLDKRNRTAIAQFTLQISNGSDPLMLLGRYLHQRAGLPPSQLNEINLRQLLQRFNIQESLVSGLSQWLEQYQQAYRQAEGKTGFLPQASEELVRLVVELDRALPAANNIAPENGVQAC